MHGSDLDLAGAVRWTQANHKTDKDGREWEQWATANGVGPMRDPARHSAETLRRFLEDVKEGLSDQVLDTARKRDQALQQLESTLGDSPKEKSLIRLLKLTRDHINFSISYGCLCLDASKPTRLKRKVEAPANVEDLLLAVDCEMVETEEDDNTLAQVCACNAAGEVLMNRLVKPEGTITDFRTAITGIEAKDLENLDYSLHDAQAELRRLIGPQTVLVGHTLHRDLSAMRMDALLILDISLLYGIHGQPKRRPALAHLVKQVLRRDDFRAANSTEVHDCVQDVLMTMEVALHRLRNVGNYGKEVPVTVWVAAPPAVETELAARKLYVHRIPQRDDAFPALASLFAGLPRELSVEGLQMVTTAMGNQKLKGAEVSFLSKDLAEQAFLALPAESVEIDQAQRPQKLVRIHFPERTALVCVRPVLAGIGRACLETPTLVKEEAAPPESERTPAPPEEKPTPEAKPAAKVWQGKGWPGWRRAAEEALRAAPGQALHWMKLASELVERRQQQAGGSSKEASEPLETLQLLALAALPEEFISDETPLVRLPG
ncbi:unnamed protein product [Durusdinium trenchii]|uniref:Small RNA degrading nuclease 1 n=2 Tax=Durusdinium trenchii TaxID=1381693 RepID=A0ABP0SCL7_9DINO